MMKTIAASLTALALIGGPALASENAASQQREKLERLWAESRGDTKAQKTESAIGTRTFFSTTFGSSVDTKKAQNRLERDRKERLEFGR